MYHQDPLVNRIMLVAINDGDGSQCGYTYAQRCTLAQQGFRLVEFRHMARNVLLSEGLYDTAPRSAWVEAGNCLQDYYDRHIQE